MDSKKVFTDGLDFDVERKHHKLRDATSIILARLYIVSSNLTNILKSHLLIC